MSLSTIPAGKFFAGWLPAMVISAAVDPAPRLADLFAFPIGGYVVPPVTCALGAIGVLAARPLARKAENELSWPLFILVSLIMLILVELWVLEQRPGALFAFVIALGLGFSGYSLIELLGAELKEFVSSRFKAITAKLGGSGASDEGQP